MRRLSKYIPVWLGLLCLVVQVWYLWFLLHTPVSIPVQREDVRSRLNPHRCMVFNGDEEVHVRLESGLKGSLDNGTHTISSFHVLLMEEGVGSLVATSLDVEHCEGYTLGRMQFVNSTTVLYLRLWQGTVAFRVESSRSVFFGLNVGRLKGGFMSLPFAVLQTRRLVMFTNYCAPLGGVARMELTSAQETVAYFEGVIGVSPYLAVGVDGAATLASCDSFKTCALSK